MIGLSGTISPIPAEFITTELTRDDLVLAQATAAQIAELENWMRYQDVLMNEWNMKRWIKPGYRALFHGPPGTGKTLAALILGKSASRDVFRIDLSMVVSKFIGETEKNLSRLFERAKNKDWILFFDEAGLKLPSEAEINLIAKKYEITGAGIVNVVQYCSLEALAGNTNEISPVLIISWIEREYQKEGRVF